MAEQPAQGPASEYPIHLRTMVNIWACLMVILYCSSLYGWIRPETLKFILPSLTRSAWETLGAKALLLACATGATLAMGFQPGRLATHFLRFGGIHPLRAIPLGWALSGTAIMGLGLAGLLFTPVFIALALIAVASSLPGLVRALRKARVPAFPAFNYLFIIPAAAVLWSLLLMLLAPEIFQDPLRYHLFIPKRFNLEHKWFFIDHYFFWSYMGPFHALYGQAMAIAGVPAAKGVNLAAALVNFAALVRIATAIGIPRAWRPVTYAALITQPGLMLITGSVFAEHAMAVYILLALEALLALGRAPSRSLREAALFLAIGFNMKFTAVFGLAGLALAAGLPSVRLALAPAVRRGWKPVLATVSAFLLPWFAMKWLFTSDPVSPALAQLGFTTMDSPSRHALKGFYEFATNSVAEFIQSPDRLLIFPFIFSGGHEGFWEHPGPVISALIPLSILVFRNASDAVRVALLYAAGSALAWMVIVGGVSPHYVGALTPLWALALAGGLLGSGLRKWRIISWFLAFSILFQSLIAVVVVVKGWFPATVAMGELPEDYYLQRFSIPVDINYPIRKRLEEVRPHRGTTYVYGDDTSFYLEGRVFVDYELGNHPLIWEFARESADPARLQIKFRQNGITHILFSTRWPDLLAGDGKVAFIYDRRTLAVMQDFWRRYSRPILVMESEHWLNSSESYVFEVSSAPAGSPYSTDFSKYPPRLPGACGLTWKGDQAWNLGQSENALQLYRKNLDLFPESAILRYRLAILENAFGRKEQSHNLIREMEKSGWTSRKLRAQLNFQGR